MSGTGSLPGVVGIVGLGLIGGSLARDLRARGVRVLGHDASAETLRAAAASGVEPLDALSPAALSPVELLAIAVPVTTATALLPALADAIPAGCIVTDLGSTKRSIVGVAERCGLGPRFVGSHPIAGDHRSGWGATREGLFAGARVFLSPTRFTEPGALRRVERLWGEIGARPVQLGAAEHDLQLAWTSHLPQVASSALAAALRDAGYRPEQLGPGGRDMTRLAASSPAMWSAIAADNADLIAAALLALEERIGSVRAALERGDTDALHRFFTLASLWTRDIPHPP